MTTTASFRIPILTCAAASLYLFSSCIYGAAQLRIQMRREVLREIFRRMCRAKQGQVALLYTPLEAIEEGNRAAGDGFYYRAITLRLALLGAIRAYKSLRYLRCTDF